MSSHIAEDSFLDLVKSEETPIKIGVKTSPNTIFIEGILYSYDDDAIILDMTDKGAMTLIYKHSIVTIST